MDDIYAIPLNWFWLCGVFTDPALTRESKMSGWSSTSDGPVIQITKPVMLSRDGTQIENKFPNFTLCLVHWTNTRVLKPRWRSRPATLAAVRPTAEAMKVPLRGESQMKPFPLIIPVYIHWIDCLLAAWTAERPAIGSGHHLINARGASSIQSHCMVADGRMEGWINNEEGGREGRRQLTRFCRVDVSWRWVSFLCFVLFFLSNEWKLNIKWSVFIIQGHIRVLTVVKVSLKAAKNDKKGIKSV